LKVAGNVGENEQKYWDAHGNDVIAQVFQRIFKGLVGKVNNGDYGRKKCSAQKLQEFLSIKELREREAAHVHQVLMK